MSAETACSVTPEKRKNMVRKFVIYDTDQGYVEYILWYRRMHGER